MHTIYFAVLSLNGTIHPYFVKWYTIVKRYLSPSDITCLDNSKYHKNHNYGS